MNLTKNSHKANFKLALILLPLFIITMLIGAYYNMKNKDKQLEKLRTDYPVITKENEINGKVTGILRPDGFKHGAYTAYLKISSFGKKRLRTDPNTNEPYLYVLYEGDY